MQAISFSDFFLADILTSMSKVSLPFDYILFEFHLWLFRKKAQIVFGLCSAYLTYLLIGFLNNYTFLKITLAIKKK